MTREEIKNALLECGYPQTNGLERTLDRLLSLNGEPFDMLRGWVKFKILPNFDFSSQVNSQLLYDELCFKAPAIILAYDMLIKDPESEKLYIRLLTKNMIFNPQYKI